MAKNGKKVKKMPSSKFKSAKKKTSAIKSFRKAAAKKTFKKPAAGKIRFSGAKKISARMPKKASTVRKAPAQHAAPKLPKSKIRMNALWCEQLLGNPTIRNWLIKSVGEHSIHVIQEFSQEMSDEEIARRAEIRSSDVRVVLNKLHSYGLASYSRSRDKNSGWYSYVWKLNCEKAGAMMAEVSGRQGEKEQCAPDDGSEHYACKNCAGTQVGFEEATDLMFRCRQCGSSLDYCEHK